MDREMKDAFLPTLAVTNRNLIAFLTKKYTLLTAVTQDQLNPKP